MGQYHSSRKLSPPLSLLLTGVTYLLSSCAAQPQNISTQSSPITGNTTTAGTSTEITSAYISFSQNNFYSLINPNTSQCAGDAKTYYDTLELGVGNQSDLPKALDTSAVDPSTTIRPSFIKNVSVEITNANSLITANHSSACSFGVSSSSPPASTCATFDYDLSYGASSTPQGKFLLFGGMHSLNYTGIVPSPTPSGFQNQGLATTCGVVSLPMNDPINNAAPTLSNICYASSFYALGADILPSSAVNLGLTPGLDATKQTSTGSISMWYDLYDTNTASLGPYKGFAGATAAFNPALSQLVIFGGSSPARSIFPSSLSSTASSIAPTPGSSTYDTWLYDFTLEKWTQTGATAIPTSMSYTQDDNGVDSSTLLYSKSEGSRALFGYLAAPHYAFSQFVMNSTTPATFDTTDRILILGGRGLSGQSFCNNDGMCPDLHRFNPTFGPELMDNSSSSNPITSAAVSPAQWIDSFHTTVLTNLYNTPPSSTAPYPNPVSAYYGAFPILNNKPYAPPMSSASSLLMNNNTSTAGKPGTPYVMAVGGFYGYPNNSGKTITNCTINGSTTNDRCGALSLNLRWAGQSATTAYFGSAERNTGNALGIANAEDGTRLTPTQWIQIPDTATATTPWFGGGVALRGIDIDLQPNQQPAPLPSPFPTLPSPSGPYLNQVAYFGGSSCRDYLLNTDCSWNSTGNPNRGRYWVFGVDPAFTMSQSGSYPSTLNWGTPAPNPNSILPFGTHAPANAGMAATRGLDPNGNPIIVAWGGVISPGTQDRVDVIYYLYNNNNVPTWGVYQFDSTTLPHPNTAYVNSAMVYSHVTGKFYIFGGVDLNYGPTSSVNETWELSFTPGTSQNCGKVINQAANPCQFTWRKLIAWTPSSQSPGMTCYPFCPPGRRSHRMVEVNYNNITAPLEPSCTDPNTPCSFGIFMQGGTADGTENSATGPGLTNNTASDRWMFDPTANAGNGHWQLVNQLPPRTLASMASASYYAPHAQLTAHRAVLFGGETGLENPAQAAHGYFIPPTLGDTWIFDYTSGSWNRANLYGKRYTSPITSLSQTESRAASLINDPSSQFLSPPPLAGAIMVTRSLNKPNHLSSDPPNTLKIPEIFLFGGRDKTGHYNTLNQVFKFCIGSTGEKPVGSPFLPFLNSTTTPVTMDDASCDAHDIDTNPFSPSPTTAAAGRWLYKQPISTPSSPPIDLSHIGSYLGAGAYDASRDLILLFGGLTDTDPNAQHAVTRSTTRIASSDLYEYTPPSRFNADPDASKQNGSWRKVLPCNSPTPTGRYAHSLAYDANHRQILLTGGYDSSGNLLTQTITPDIGTSYVQPDSWIGTRIDSRTNEMPDLGIPAITNGPFPCYYWKPLTRVGNKINDLNNPPPNTGIAHAIGFFIPSSGYSTGYYTLFDRTCVNQGVISNNDPRINKLMVGGSYIDIDRTQLHPNENLLLNVSFIPFGNKTERPNHTFYAQEETAIFKVHLIHTGESSDTLKQALQPRNLTYASTDSFPMIVDTLSVLAPPTGEIQQAQVLIPLASDSRIDRIKIERYSGSAILIDASIHKLSPPINSQ